MPSHSKIVVAVPMKRKEAFSALCVVSEGWCLVFLGSGKMVGYVSLERVGGLSLEGSSVRRCFMFASPVAIFDD